MEHSTAERTQFSEAPANPPGDRPIFIFAQSRSGSTLLQRLLNSLDGVIIYGEHLGILKGVAAAYLEFIRRRTKGHTFCSEDPDPAAVQRLALRRLKDPTDFSPNANGFSYVHVTESFRGFVRRLIHCISEPPFQRWGFKEIRYDSTDAVFDMLVDLFPAATFLCLVRDPVAQIASWEGTGWNPVDLDEKCRRWKLHATSFLQYHRQRPASTFLLRYEDLIHPDEAAVRQLLHSLGYEYTVRQQELVFGLGAVGASAHKPVFNPEVQQRIRTLCLDAETATLYPA
jgi:hypothetical protein